MLTEKEHDAISLRLFDQLERIQAELEAARTSKPLRRKLLREDYALRQEFAKHLMIKVDSWDFFSGVHRKPKRVYDNGSSKIRAYRRVDGVPNKRGRIEAAAWMASRNVSWTGSAPDLRREVQKALNNDELVPDGYFGLHVELTVEIQSVEWLTLSDETGARTVPGVVRYS